MERLERLGKATVDSRTKQSLYRKTLEESETVLIIDYYVEKSTGVKEISITPDKFAGYFYIEGDTLFRRQSDGKDLAAQIIIPNAKIQTAFNFSMSPSGDPSTFIYTDAVPRNFSRRSTWRQKVVCTKIMTKMQMQIDADEGNQSKCIRWCWMAS